MRYKDLLRAAFRDAQKRDSRERLVASTVDIIAAARKYGKEIGPDEVKEHIEWYERGWVILEETPSNNNVYIKAHNY